MVTASRPSESMRASAASMTRARDSVLRGTRFGGDAARRPFDGIFAPASSCVLHTLSVAVQSTVPSESSSPAARPALSKREARKRATARALRQAAIRLIAERGYDATSTADIAAGAGVTQRTFFNYFPTKEAVVMLPADLLSNI